MARVHRLRATVCVRRNARHATPRPGRHPTSAAASAADGTRSPSLSAMADLATASPPMPVRRSLPPATQSPRPLPPPPSPPPSPPPVPDARRRRPRLTRPTARTTADADRHPPHDSPTQHSTAPHTTPSPTASRRTAPSPTASRRTRRPAKQKPLLGHLIPGLRREPPPLVPSNPAPEAAESLHHPHAATTVLLHEVGGAPEPAERAPPLRPRARRSAE